MARKTRCYIDTSAFIAFLDRSDSFHGLFKRLFSDPPLLVTSSLVVAEGHGWFLRRYDARRAIQFLNLVHALPGLDVEAFDSVQLQKTTAMVQKFGDQSLTLADAHGLVLMDSLHIRTCWSTDRHLTLKGALLVI